MVIYLYNVIYLLVLEYKHVMIGDSSDVNACPKENIMCRVRAFTYFLVLLNSISDYTYINWDMKNTLIKLSKKRYVTPCASLI